MSDQGKELKAVALTKWSKFGLSAYDKIDDVSSFVASFGKAISDSKMFGCHNVAQGQVLAMACVAERMNPVELTRRYHIIGGNLSMKSDAMLAEFRRRGGDHTMITRTPDEAEIELRVGKGRGAKVQRFKFTWDEAKNESYVYMKDGKTLKDNWSTPRRRMQMLWARLTSDSVRVMMPEVNAGQYTPEELGETVAEAETEAAPGDEIDASYTVIAEPVATSAAEPEPKPAAESESEATAEPVMPFDAFADAEKEAKERTGSVTRPQLFEMKRIKDKLALSAEVWAKVVGKFGVRSAKDLTYDHADRVLAWLTRRERDASSQDQLSKWANDAIAKSAGPADSTRSGQAGE